MPEPTPQVSGSDILSYTGNAGLAAGANTGGILPQQGDPYSGIATTIDHINEQHAQQKVREYQQKIKDQEQLANVLAETDGSVFNMKGENGKNMSYTPLPDDQKILTEKAHDLRKTILAKPDSYMFDQNYLDKLNEYKNLTRHAGMRAVAYSKYNQEAATTNNPEERQSILDMRKAEVEQKPLTDYHMPEPHLPMFNYDPEAFIASKDVKDTKNFNTFKVSSGKDAQGNIIHTEMDGINDNTLDFRARVQPSGKNYADAINLANGYVQTIQNNPALVEKHNQNIDAINLQRGYVDENGQPISPHYIPHVAEVINTPNGPKVQMRTNNPADIAYSVMAEKYGQLQPSKEIKKDAIDVQKENMGMQKMQHDMDNADQKLKLAQQEHELKKSEASRKALESAKKEKATYGAISQSVEGVYKSATDARNSATKTLTDIKAEYPDADKSTLQSAFTANNIKEDDYLLASIPVDEGIRHIAGVRDMSADGKKELPSSKKPEVAYYLKSKIGNPQDDRYLIGYQAPGLASTKKSEKKALSWKMIPLNEAINNSVASHANYSTVKPEYKDRAQEAFNDMMNGKIQKKTAPISSGIQKIDGNTIKKNGVTYKRDPATGEWEIL